MSADDPIYNFELLLKGELTDLSGEKITKYRDAILQKYKGGPYKGRSLEINMDDDVFIIPELQGKQNSLPKLRESLMGNPQRTLEDMGNAIKRVMTEIIGEGYATGHIGRFHARPFNVRTTIIKITNIDMSVIGRIVCVMGIITKVSEIKPKLVKGTYYCNKCDDTFETIQEHVGFYKPPLRCGSQGCAPKQGKFELRYEDSEYVDWQELFLQQLPEELESGQTPRGIKLIMLDDLVNAISPGDRVIVTGILRLSPAFRPTMDEYQDPVMNKFLEVLHVRRLTEIEQIELTEQDVKDIKAFSKREDLDDVIINSISPETYGYREVKHGLALMAFGGVLKERNEYESKRDTSSDDLKDLNEDEPIDAFFSRSEIHILLVGDPGTNKSKILRNMRHVSPRYQYASGKKASSVGITASVVKDKKNDIWTLEAGACVLGSGGIVAIDELDKMRPDDRSGLLEVMEDQTVTINKAGINATLNAKCAILSAMNPKGETYDDSLPFVDNVNLEEVLRDRFDLIFVIRDRPSEKWDKGLARHLFNLHRGRSFTPEKSSVKPISLSFLKKYIKYAKTIDPLLTQEVEDLGVEHYGDMRRATRHGDMIGYKPRDITTIIRLAEANARMHLRKKTAEEDFEKARELLEYFKKELFMDEDGEYDTGRVTGKGGKRQRVITDKLLLLIEELEREDTHKVKGVPTSAIVEKAVKLGLVKTKDPKHAKNQVKILLDKLIERDALYRPVKDVNAETYKVTDLT